MAVIRPFRAIRPTAELADKIAALPYDTMNSAEAREAVRDNPYSFLHVDKAEIDLPEEIDHYDRAVYERARGNIQKMIADGDLVKEAKPAFYVYRLIMDGHPQSGLVVTTSIDDYANNVIKKHEFTRADKEEDRIRHVDITDHHTGPIYLTYVEQPQVDETIATWQRDHAPVYDFTADDGIQHTVWVVDSEPVIARLTKAFAGIDSLYIADGHHRAASAVKVGFRRRDAVEVSEGEQEYDYFLSVLFPKDQLRILDYNRVIADLNGHTPEEVRQLLGSHFEVDDAPESPYAPTQRHEFGMLLDGRWYRLRLKPGMVDEADPVQRLDVAIMQNLVLGPVFGILDPRTDKRVDFVGGIRGLKELERRVGDDMACAFSLYPTSLADLIAIADAGEVMPPKSTWFEPKMRSGLFLHSLS